jgi:tRNA wybutosine-synthesizing protein 3
MTHPHPFSTSTPPIPAPFLAKKRQILSLLHQDEDTYTDNSPKGSVDVQIRDLIAEINAHEGLVTTSSCAGRVAVFVEGGADRGVVRGGDLNERDGEAVKVVDESKVEGKPKSRLYNAATTTTTTTTATSPGGKGGGRWLYVSHEPVAALNSTSTSSSSAEFAPKGGNDFTNLFNLTPTARYPTSTSNTIPSHPQSSPNTAAPTRLIHLSFSPLILHIHCASLRHAKPVIAAAINAGFRESGVQSLKILDDPEAGVMVAVRTAGLSFETVVGVVVGKDEGGDERGNGEGQDDGVMQSVVSEEYLAMCVDVVNERFRWNEERRERFRRELAAATGREDDRSRRGWEDKEERRRRKMEEGLMKRRAGMRTEDGNAGGTNDEGKEGQDADLEADLSKLDMEPDG